MPGLVLRRVSLALAFAIPAAAHAQRPDFSGTWLLSPDTTVVRVVAASGDAPFRKGDMGIGWGSPLSIAQSADRLVLTYEAYTAYDAQPKVHLTVRLDGAESRNRVVLGSAPESRSTAVWQDTVLVITTTFPAPVGVHAVPGALTVRHTLAVDARTGRMTVTARRLDANGAENVVTGVFARR